MELLTQPHLPTTPAGCPILSRQAPNPLVRGGWKGPKWAGFRYEMGLTHRLTGQGRQ